MPCFLHAPPQGYEKLSSRVRPACAESFSKDVDSLLHEKEQSHKGARLRATQNFPGHEEIGKIFYVGPHLHEKVRSHTGCASARMHDTRKALVQLPARSVGGRPAGEKFSLSP